MFKVCALRKHDVCAGLFLLAGYKLKPTGNEASFVASSGRDVSSGQGPNKDSPWPLFQRGRKN